MKNIRNIIRYISLFLLCFVTAIEASYAQTTLTLERKDAPYPAIGNAKRMNNGDGTVTDLQATHILRQTVYINPNSGTRILQPQTKKISRYMRWFRFDTKADLPTTFTLTGITGTFSNNNGVLFGTAKGKETDCKYPTITSASIGTSIACDVSKLARSGNIEPTLSYRLIFDIKSAKEIADKIELTSKESPLESYSMIAPTGMQLLIGPKETYQNIQIAGIVTGYELNCESNYFVKNSDGTYKATRSGTSATNEFYWECFTNNATTGTIYTDTIKTRTMNNNGIVDGKIYNGHILALPAVTTSGTKRVCYLRNSAGKCIAKFDITYENKDNVGPKIDGWASRTSAKLAQQYKLVTKRDFDYNTYSVNANGSVNFKQYMARQLPWYESSYGFHASDTTSSLANYVAADWSEYAFVTTLPTSKMNWCYSGVYDRLYTNSGKTKAGFMYYVDASEAQGVISNLDISDACCPGTHLYISTWIRNVNSQGYLGPNMNFEIVGTKTDGTEMIMKTFTTGTMPVGSADGGNSWQQIFFSFDVPKITFTKMGLRIVNNQISSAGDDFVIDDIEIYMTKPAGKATLRAPMCGESAVVHVDLDYFRLLDLVATTSTSSAFSLPIGYSFVDKRIYDNYLSGINTDGSTVAAADRTEAKALEKARVRCDGVAAVDGSAYYSYFLLKFGRKGTSAIDSLNIKSYYDSIYVEEPSIAATERIDVYNTNYNQLLSNQKTKVFKSTYYDSDEKKNKAALSFQATLIGTADMPITAGREYYILFNISSPYNQGDVLTSDIITELKNSAYYTKSRQCNVYTSFELMGTATIELNGSTTLYHGGTDVCANTRPTFAVRQLQYVQNGVIKQLSTDSLDMYFDWYKGTLYDFKNSIYYPTASGGYTTNKDNGSSTTPFSAYTALKKFRNIYPAATLISDYQAAGEYTPAMKALLIELTKSKNTGSTSDNTLTLYKKNYSPAINPPLGTIYYFLAIPIDKPVKSQYQTGYNLLCLEPQALSITASSLAPSMTVGIDGVDYGSRSIVPLRIGLSQIKEVVSTSTNPSTDATRSKYYLKLPINKNSITFSSTTYSQLLNVTNSSSNFQRVYLIDSNDPNVGSAVSQSKQLGYINWLNIKRGEDNNYVAIYFSIDANSNLPITFREGYVYVLKFYFSEYILNTTETSNACEGAVIMPLKIVPEYQVWTGGDSNWNWNNDANWRRAEAIDFYGPSSYQSNDNNYLNTQSENRKSFVPMKFTKVIIDRTDSKAPRLASLSAISSTNKALNMSTDTLIIKKATTDIEYDMVVNDKVVSSSETYYPCTTFYGNTCDRIYFKTGTGMMNPHLLKYNKAHVDFTINNQKWYLLGTPLYGVVAGDMYTTSTTGKQETHAFENIAYSTATNNRFNPAIYQRAWDKVTATTYEFNGGTSNAASQTSRNVAIKAAWSSVYNDVKVQYLPGTGYTIRSVQKDKNITHIRLPKSDSKFSYYTTTGSSDGGDDTDVSTYRTKAGLLASDGLSVSNPNLQINLSQTMSSTGNLLGNKETTNRLYLLANPFMCHLDMQKFFAANPKFETKYWLMTEDKQTAVIMGTEGVIGASSADAVTSLAPMQGFFVRLNSGETANPTVTYNLSMMTTGSRTLANLTRSVDNEYNQLYMTATRNGMQGTAMLQSSTTSEDDANTETYVPTLLNSDCEDYPVIYTIGEEQAMQIQTIGSRVSTIPLGIYSNSEDSVSVSFYIASGFENLSLYDSYTNSYLPIEKESTIQLPGQTNGRYLLTYETGMQENFESTITISSLEEQTILVTSSVDDPIERVQIYTTDGMLRSAHTHIDAYTYSIRQPSGVYIVVVKTQFADKIGKILVK